MTLALVMAVFAPLLAAVPLALSRERVGASGPGWIAAGACASLGALLWVGASGVEIRATWLEGGGATLSLGLRADGLGWLMGLFVAGVGALVCAYSVGYARALEAPAGFAATLGFFLSAMLALVLSSSLLLLFIAWELIGLASFILIGFHYHDAAARSAARLAFLTTRVTDLALLALLLLAFVRLGTSDITAFVSAVREGSFGVDAAAPALLILIASLGKSAQLPLSAWLPRAMLAPSPVSALLHSATLVAAGVFAIARLYPVFEAAPAALDVLLWVGALTALAGALIAGAASDLKQLLAWSTVSQLGEMWLALGLLDTLGAIQHLLGHGLFKASLFLAAGVFERAAGGRDLSRLVGVARAEPIAGVAFVVGALALAGVPFGTGHLAQESLLSAAYERGAAGAAGVCLLLLLASAYSARAVTLIWRRPAVGDAGLQAVRRDPTPYVMGGAALALALGAWLAHPLLDGPAAGVLGEVAPASPPWTWRAALVAAALGGLGGGAASALRRGAAPLWGGWPLTIARALDRGLAAPARLPQLTSRPLEAAERAFDRGASALARAARAVSSRAVTAELFLERGSTGLARSSTRAARRVVAVDDAALERATVQLGARLRRASGELGRLETGKIYHYAGSLLGCVVVLGTLLVLVALGGLR